MRVLAAAVGETHSDVRLEGALVRGEAGVAINPEQRAPRRTWVSQEKGAELGEMGREAADEQQRGFEDALVSRLVFGDPFAVVVSPKLPQELEQLRVEGSAVRHWPSQNRPQIRTPHSWRTPESLGPLQRHSNRRSEFHPAHTRADSCIVECACNDLVGLCEVRPTQPAVGGFIREPSNGGKPLVDAGCGEPACLKAQPIPVHCVVLLGAPPRV